MYTLLYRQFQWLHRVFSKILKYFPVEGTTGKGGFSLKTLNNTTMGNHPQIF